MEQAVDFIEEFFIAKKSRNSNTDEEELSKRLLEIKRELEETGSYTLKTPELLFGAKTAWRNASRCIGRIQWNNIDLYDCRHVRTTEDMFQCLCVHMKNAYNGGNIRSSITIFPQRVTGKEDFRLWNHQLYAFAGKLSLR
jgi:nitric oxide synthase oxygenase domain/subunit